MSLIFLGSCFIVSAAEVTPLFQLKERVIKCLNGGEK